MFWRSEICGYRWKTVVFLTHRMTIELTQRRIVHSWPTKKKHEKNHWFLISSYSKKHIFPHRWPSFSGQDMITEESAAAEEEEVISFPTFFVFIEAVCSSLFYFRWSINLSIVRIIWKQPQKNPAPRLPVWRSPKMSGGAQSAATSEATDCALQVGLSQWGAVWDQGNEGWGNHRRIWRIAMLDRWISIVRWAHISFCNWLETLMGDH